MLLIDEIVIKCYTKSLENFRHATDAKRQMRLARLRVDSRRKRLQTTVSHHKELDDYARPEKGLVKLLVKLLVKRPVK